MRKVLLPVDGSDTSQRAAAHVIKLHGEGVLLEIHLLNVQPPLRGDVALFVPEQNADDFHREQGEQELRAAEDLLKISGVEYVRHLAVGAAAETIQRFAQERNIDEIVMGARGLGTVAGLLLGSITAKVLHIVQVPVTVVK